MSAHTAIEVSFGGTIHTDPQPPSWFGAFTCDKSQHVSFRGYSFATRIPLDSLIILKWHRRTEGSGYCQIAGNPDVAKGEQSEFCNGNWSF